MRKLIYLVVFIVAITLNYQQVDARVLEINLEKMVRKAGKIVAGRCVEVQKGFHPEYTNVKVTFIELDIFDNIKGNAGKSLKFMQFGHGNEIQHASRYKKGEEILLFLYPASKSGFTSPVGGYQGKFSIKTEPISDKPTFVQLLNKKKLFKGIETKKLEKIKEKINLEDNDSGLISYEIFRQLIQAFINKPEDEESNK